MFTSNFKFLEKEYPKLSHLGFLAEKNVYDDPSTSLTKLRILSEKLPQAILAKTFKGELVAQLPSDGSAQELLES